MPRYAYRARARKQTDDEHCAERQSKSSFDQARKTPDYGRGVSSSNSLNLLDIPVMNVDCVIPFGTTGLMFAINDIYCRYADLGLGNHCTIYQLLRYTLVQFDYHRLRGISKCPIGNYAVRMDAEMEHSAKHATVNFKVLVAIVESYGVFTHREQRYFCAMGPENWFDPSNVRLSNLRALVEMLTVEASPEFVQNNTLPGAQFNTDSILINANDIIPAVYTHTEFRDDAFAVRRGLDAMKSKFSNCWSSMSYSGVGKPHVAMTTECTDQRDYIPNCYGVPPASAIRGPIRLTVTKLRDWYSIYGIEESDIPMGILAYSGIYHRDWLALYPDAALRISSRCYQGCESSWSTSFDQATPVVRKIPYNEKDLSSSNSFGPADVEWYYPQSLIPFGTTGLMFAINDIYCRYANWELGNHCTIYQLLRYTLVQFEYQRSQSDIDCSWIRDNNIGEIVSYRATVNFNVLVAIVESYGVFTHREQRYFCAMRPEQWFDPSNVRLSNLRALVEKLTREASPEFVQNNTLPGAQFNADNILTNADDIIPAVYTDTEFLKDAFAVCRGLEAMKLKFSDCCLSMSYLREGKPHVAMTTERTHQRDYIPNCYNVPPARAGAPPVNVDIPGAPRLWNEIRMRIQPTVTEQRMWYSIYRIEASAVSMGILSYSGVYLQDWVAQYPDAALRMSSKCHQRCSSSWRSLITQAITWYK